MNKSQARDFLTTGAAAQLLGSSRQHVVNLCNRGVLECERMPVHRRLLRSDVEALAHTRKGMTREELRSLWLNRAVAARLARDPERVLARARQNLDRFQDFHAGSSVEHWLKRWREVLDAGPEAVMETLTSTASDAAELRQNSPFPGVLPEAERRMVLDSFARYWKQRVA